MIDLAHRRTRPRLRYGDELSVVVRQPPRGRLPGLLAVYKRDARQLVRAGLAGGKGIPETITGAPVRVRHPHRPLVRAGPLPADARQDRAALPSPPRRQRAPLPARPRHLLPDPPRRDTIPGSGSRCAATATTTTPPCCSTPTRGTCGAGSPPTCPATSPAAWASPRNGSRALVRIRFVKVAEYQARGVVHFHAVIRLDAPGEDYQPPPPGITAAMLCDAIGQAAAAVATLTVDHDGQRRHARVRRADRHPAHPARQRPARHRPGADGQAVANYIAKYATKTLDRPRPALTSGSAPRSTSRHLRCRAHYRRMITTAWQLGGTPGPTSRCRAWAHMLGYGGHFLTKSRRYSVTFGQLRHARTDHRRAAAPPRRRPRPLGPAPGRDRRPGPATPGPTPAPATPPPRR